MNIESLITTIVIPGLLGYALGRLLWHVAIHPVIRRGQVKIAEPQVLDILGSSGRLTLLGIWMKLETFVMKDDLKLALDGLVKSEHVERSMSNGEAFYRISDGR